MRVYYFGRFYRAHLIELHRTQATIRFRTMTRGVRIRRVSLRKLYAGAYEREELRRRGWTEEQLALLIDLRRFNENHREREREVD